LTTFILGCAGLVLLSGLFYLIPRQRPGGADEDLQRANLDWYRLRREELEREGSDSLQDDARLRLLEDEQQRPALNAAAAPAGRFPAWLLLPLVALLSSGLYYRLGAAPDVLITRQLQSLDENSSPEAMQALMSSIEARSAQRPQNQHYTAMLGRYYMGQQDYGRAARTYAELARENPEDAQALAYAAQADYLASGRKLSELARMRAEQALAVNPHQRTALGLLGMASFEQQRYTDAITYWERLLAMEPPESESARMISGVIAEARSRLGEPSDSGQAEPAVAVAGAGVTVRVVLPEGASVDAADTVFVLARNAGSDSRMPIAVQRLQASQLPFTLRLDDSNSMAGQMLSDSESVVVIVQVSPDGRPGEANATWLGQVGPLAPGLDTEPLEIVLQPRS
jgi:cytochrome c-type biogenesis protein CcmH